MNSTSVSFPLFLLFSLTPADLLRLERNSDEITKHNMMGNMKTMVPGCNVIGKIVKCGSKASSMGMKEGMMVCGSSSFLSLHTDSTETLLLDVLQASRCTAE
jgi:hypothetical protein